jgi:hypothetical protein
LNKDKNMKKQKIVTHKKSLNFLILIIALLVANHFGQISQTANTNTSSLIEVKEKSSKEVNNARLFFLDGNTVEPESVLDFTGSYFDTLSIPASNPFNRVAGGLAPPIVNKGFGASTVPPGGITTLTISFTNPNFNPINPGGAFIIGLGIVDNLPSGMTVFPNATPTNTCGGILTAPPNSNIVQLSNGIIPPGSSCSITVLVRVTGPGPKINTTQPATAGNTAGGSNQATATITVTCPGRFTVDNLNDNIVDTAPGDGICATNFPGSNGGCTLRAAMQEANALSNFCPAGSTINFQVPGTIELLQGPLTINSGRNVTINGLGANFLTVSGNDNSGVFVNNGIATISGLTIADGDVTGTVGGSGGGLRSSGITTVRDAVITRNNARTGGGIAATGGSLTLVRTTVSGNTADDAGGIYAEDATTLLRDSTISGNSGASGEGFRNNALNGNSTATLTNSTISGNTTANFNSAIRSEASTGFTSTINLTNVTVTNNNTTTFGQNGAIWLRPLGGTNSITLKNTIVSGNLSGGLPFDIQGTVQAVSSYNLIGTGGGLIDGINENIVGVNNPLLQILANNGGTTQTHALTAGSPANDKGAAVSGITTDQRGSVRPIDNTSIPNALNGDGSDIGAFERNSVTAPPTFASADNASFQINTPGSFTITSFSNPTATISINGGTLPNGITFTNNGNGTATLSGTPAFNAGGVYQLILSANNGINPNATQNFTLTVQVPVAFTNTPSATFLVGASNSYTITTLGVPTATVSRIAGNLPSGLFYTDNGNGTATISGNPVAGSGGIYPLTISADNGVSAEVIQDFVLTINESPVFTSPDRAGFLINSPGSFFVRTRGYPFPVNLSIISGSLPNSITFNPATGLFSGTPGTIDLGSYPLTIQAANGTSPDAFQSFTLNVCQVADVTVNSLAESGAGSLRQVIIDACPGSTITIAPSVTGQINLSSPLTIEKDLNIVGPGANLLTLRGVSNRILFIGNNTVNISGLTISNGNSNFFGGAIINGGNLTLTDSVVSNSNAVNEGGGIYSSGNLSLIRSTISGNSGGNGGGVYSLGSLTMINSTVSGNRSAASGGGIYIDGTANIINCTFTNNRADSDANGNGLGGGIFNNNLVGSNLVTMQNTLVVLNYLRPVFSNPVINETAGAPINGSYNFVGTQGFSPTAILNQTLAMNGGTTPTHSIPNGSPLIDQGAEVNLPLANLIAPLTTDQRGFMRPADFPLINNAPGGNGSDIGAYEVQLAPTAVSVTVSGRVLTSTGRGISKARVILTMPDGERKIAQSNSFGYFRFNEIAVGQAYTFQVSSKQYTFTPQVIVINDELTNLNFIAQ